MKLAGNVFFGLVMVGTIVFLSSVSFAQTAPAAGKDASERGAKREAIIKALQDSAAALQQTNPDLAKKLSDVANERIKKMKVKLDGNKETVTIDSAEKRARPEGRVALFKEAAAALQQSHPDLAKSLKKLTVVDQETEAQNTIKENNEEDEGGKVEPTLE